MPQADNEISIDWICRVFDWIHNGTIAAAKAGQTCPCKTALAATESPAARNRNQP